MKRVKKEEIFRVLDKIKNVSMLVVGDMMLDCFVWGKVNRISPEAPVPVVKVAKESYMPGGAANVVNNLMSLGAYSFMCGVIGGDLNGERLCSILEPSKVNLEGVIKINERGTIVKTRVIAHQQQVVRFDKEQTDQVSDKIIKEILHFAKTKINDFNAVIIEDYGKGLIQQKLVTGIIKMCKDSKKIVAFDPKLGRVFNLNGATVFTPNHYEGYSFAGLNIDRDDILYDAGKRLLNKFKTKYVLMTLGEKGMCLFENGKKPFKISSSAREVYDVSGAGDTVISSLTAALAVGADIKVAAVIANYAAGIVVAKLGTATTTVDEVRTAVMQKH